MNRQLNWNKWRWIRKKYKYFLDSIIISYWMNKWKGIYVPFNALSAYIGTATSEGMNKMKDDCPFRPTLDMFKPTLAIGLRFRGRRR